MKLDIWTDGSDPEAGFTGYSARIQIDGDVEPHDADILFEAIRKVFSEYWGEYAHAAVLDYQEEKEPWLTLSNE